MTAERDERQGLDTWEPELCRRCNGNGLEPSNPAPVAGAVVLSMAMGFLLGAALVAVTWRLCG